MLPEVGAVLVLVVFIRHGGGCTIMEAVLFLRGRLVVTWCTDGRRRDAYLV